ncbi:hypothetical protein [Limnobacter parvus]|uniref:Uncharacterized protein n=1 Tax=Limnobacter parvus TaxID=2939690 RepID=A0ABT1XJ60_9BURK|nr:hypothetical protein [Limnobacter parvus]MCR2746134.1 hypothetical protein [Limnobacter parvus]
MPELESPIDSWTLGVRQKELNERGAYAHRFNKAGSRSSMVDAVKKISQDSICTPCTYIGPSLCRTYNHSIWEGCAALLFSPAMNLVLGYKGDIYSARLSDLPKLSHDVHKRWFRTRGSSLPMFAEDIRTNFNKFGPTTSAFKGRATKQLNLAVSAQHHSKKIQEMEKRANQYFMPEENKSAYKVDGPSKNLILELRNRHHEFQIDSRPEFDTVCDVVMFIDAVLDAAPELEPYLSAAQEKISNFEDDAAVKTYFQNAGNPNIKPDHQVSYSSYMQWQYDAGKRGNIYQSYYDPSTVLTPNEVLGMPHLKDLVGVLIDPGKLSSFDQALETINYLKQSKNAAASRVAKAIPPYAHLISHIDEGTIIQLGWSTMIIPYSTQGLIEYCETGHITSMNNQAFSPDYFTLLHRIATYGSLVFNQKHATVDILTIKSNVIDNFSSIRDSIGTHLLRSAIQQPSINKATIQLFCHLDYLSNGRSHDNNIEAIKHCYPYAPHLRTLQEFTKLDEIEVLTSQYRLLTEQIDRIEKSIFDGKKTERSMKFRCGYTDQGTFRYNLQLGSLALKQGTRTSNKGVTWTGYFEHNDKMREGGAALSWGLKKIPEETSFGSFIDLLEPLSLRTKLNTRTGQSYASLRLEMDGASMGIDFSKSTTLRMFFTLLPTHSSTPIKAQLTGANCDLSHLNEVVEDPKKALSIIATAFDSASSIPDHYLAPTLVCFSFLHQVLLKHQEAFNRALLDSPTAGDEAIALKNAIDILINQVKSNTKKIADRHKRISFNNNEIKVLLDDLPKSLNTLVRSQLGSDYQIYLPAINEQQTSTPDTSPGTSPGTSPDTISNHSFMTRPTTRSVRAKAKKVLSKLTGRYKMPP